jgi:hypothetical protein
MADFGTFKLGPTLGLETNLPSPTEFRRDPVRQSGRHVILNGKTREDFFSWTNHFYLGWKGLTQTEYDALIDILEGVWPMSFICHVGSFPVVCGNIGPAEYTPSGFISCSLELEEAEAYTPIQVNVSQTVTLSETRTVTSV